MCERSELSAERNGSWEDVASTWGVTMTTPAFMVEVPSNMGVPFEM